MDRFSYSSLFRVLLFVCVFISVSASQNDRELENPLLDNWGKDEGLASFLHNMIESSKTESPTLGPTTENPTTAPTDRPTATPTKSPSNTPTQIPTESPTDQPSTSFYPSVQPTIHPTPQPSTVPSKSAVPTATPSAVPSVRPTFELSIVPSVSHTDEPSGSPSVEPSVEPTSEPSGRPSLNPSHSPSVSLGPTPASSSSPSFGSTEMPSDAPIVPPSISPTQSPTTSTPPSLSPTNTKATESSIIINQKNTRNATPLLIVGACCFVIMASTSLFLYSRGTKSQRDDNTRAPEMIEVSTRDRMILRPGRTFDDVNYTFTTKEGQSVEIDLEAGQVEIPNSVSIPNIDERNHFSNIIDRPSTPPNSKLCMPKSIYVPKMFQRTRDGEESSKQVITWNQIREEDSSHASSGYAPASACSPILSPFLVKGLSSILSPQLRDAVLLNESSNNGKEDAGGAVARARSTRKHAARKEHGGGKMESVTKEIGLRREVARQRDVFAMPIKHDLSDSSNEHQFQRTELKNVVSKSSDGSSIEWGVDVSKAEQPSKESFEANMAELKNILVSIKSMGSGEAPDAGEDDDMAYIETEDSSDPNTGSKNKTCKNDHASQKSDSSACLGIDIDPIEGKCTRYEQSSVQGFHSPPSNIHQPGIAYEKELISNKINDGGTFNFRNIFNDPNNDLYQCHAPSGPLGIVVDTTALGPRVRSLNPLSPIFGKISPGDVVVGVDEVDTVGMEAGEFWQVVSRKANQNQRVLTILRI